MDSLELSNHTIMDSLELSNHMEQINDTNRRLLDWINHKQDYCCSSNSNRTNRVHKN